MFSGRFHLPAVKTLYRLRREFANSIEVTLLELPYFATTSQHSNKSRRRAHYIILSPAAHSKTNSHLCFSIHNGFTLYHERKCQAEIHQPSDSLTLWLMALSSTLYSLKSWPRMYPRPGNTSPQSSWSPATGGPRWQRSPARPCNILKLLRHLFNCMGFKTECN